MTRPLWKATPYPRVVDLCALSSSQSLTCGAGFYNTKANENVWMGRKIVLRHTETGEIPFDLISSTHVDASE